MRRRKLIFVEGMDCSGKDTAIKNICNAFPKDNFHTLHYHAIKTRTAEESRERHEALYIEAFELVDRLRLTNFIFNRSHYGEYVYGYLYRDYADPDYVFEMEREPWCSHLFADACLLVLVNNDFDALLAREDGDSLSQGDRMRLVQEFERFYEVYVASAAKHKLLLNVAGLSIPEVTEKVTDWLHMVYNESTTSNDDRVGSPQR
jgi:thymidylate kinase